jgi:hypothetical protein
MRQSATLIIVGFALIVIFLIYMMQSMAIVHRVAVVDMVTGTAEIDSHDGDPPTAAHVGQLVRMGDEVRTGPDSEVELRWARMAGGLRVKLGSDTRFTIQKAIVNKSSDEEQSRLKIDDGTIWIRLRKALTGKSKFEVETPTAVAAVRGTVFRVSVLPEGATEVSVWDGVVALRPEQGSEVRVDAGASAQFRDSDGSILEAALTQQEKEQWQQQTSIVGPFLVLDEPPDETVLTGLECPFSGRTEPDSTVFVDGTSVEVGKEGEFEQLVALALGENAIEVRAVAPDGTETVLVRSVTVREGE